MEDTIVYAHKLSKTFKQKEAVRNVSFSIAKGEVVAMLGPNGAGKTTTLSLVLGLLKPTKGKVQVFQQPPQSMHVRERIGVMLQEVRMMDGLKTKEMLQLFRSYYPNPLALSEMIALTGLANADLTTKVEKLSGGQRRRVNFAVCLAGDPDFIVLDEPTAGMDTTSRVKFWKTIHQLAERGKTILFSTHYLQEADDTAKRIILLHQGQKIADGATEEIKHQLSRQYVSFRLNGKLNRAKLNVPDVLAIEEREERIYLETKNTDALISYIMQHFSNAYDLRIDKGSMDDVFETLVQGSRENE
ncbi:ABC transporter ATP-binding protein [Virgibacillus dokdonensis]|uniref:ABC transporter ATP-binding protein n=1 Tax=Virgibacillus dokdonensis TaxID=302167 RepID=A0A2K9IYZ5_9BACI|nr:ABC transporter ATP-binding protein [Virgibacillus dokdonensis]AUJ24919.1 Daunorubicin/doxorubicin resistance ATP-binding protein DrrA [Virgibacillus dokdonensis]